MSHRQLEGRTICWTNMGGPMSRTRTERITSTLLGRGDGPIRCPTAMRLGLSFGGSAPLAAMEQLLAAVGLASPEDLRRICHVPDHRLICRPAPPDAPRLPIADADRWAVLAQALMLGLCTAQVYDPSRPVLWTETSLCRGLELHDVGGFYS